MKLHSVLTMGLLLMELVFVYFAATVKNNKYLYLSMVWLMCGGIFIVNTIYITEWYVTGAILSFILALLYWRKDT